MKDKIAFVVAFLAVVIALASFKETLQGINIEYGFTTVNILTLAYISLIVLFLSAYFYALDYVRYGFKIFDRLSIFKYFQIVGDSFYLLAIMSPVIYLLIWFIVKIYFLIPLPDIDLKKYSYLINIIFSLIAVIISIYVAWSQNRERRKAKEESLDASSIIAENEARNLVEKRLWNLSIIEAFRSLELNINKKLIELGIEPARIPIFRAIDLLLRNKIIDRNDFQRIQYIRDLRNRAAHSSIEFTENEAQEVINIIKNLLPKLETSVTKYKYFEQRIIDALIGKNGLFLKHHFFRESGVKNERFDARAEGPNFDYIIEIKMSKNPKIIQRCWNQLKKYSKPNARFILVIPHSASNVNIYGENMRFLYYDIEKDLFVNRDEIYNWIYGNY